MSTQMITQDLILFVNLRTQFDRYNVVLSERGIQSLSVVNIGTLANTLHAHEDAVSILVIVQSGDMAQAQKICQSSRIPIEIRTDL